MKSWKTTTAGIATIISAIALQVAHLLDNDPETVADWPVCIAAMIAGFGFILARDNDKTSEDVKAK
jgi:hypothetical protein